MEYKIAIASTDGKVINQHFGRASEFFIVLVQEDNHYSLVEKRKVEVLCKEGGHETSTLERTADLLSDCSFLLCLQIGEMARYALEKRKIKVFAVGDYIDDAIQALITYNNQLCKVR